MISPEAEIIMNERFGKDSIIALATVDDGMPAVRNVDAYYDSGSFYIITYALSDKMRQIENNRNVAVCGEWFTARGTAENIGYFGSDENKDIATKLTSAFSEWINNGHNDFSDKNTIILRVKLDKAVLFSMGTRYDIDFSD